jgi:hypothetical protein
MSTDAPLHVDPLLSVPSPQEKPSYRLFSPGQILGASLLGSILAGAILYGINARRLGRTFEAWFTVGASLLIVVLVMLVTSHMSSEGSHSLGWLSHVLGFGIWEMAKRGQGPAYAKHIAAGGERGGTGAVVLITLGAVAIILAHAAAVWELSKPYGEQIKHGQCSLYYAKGVQRADADKVVDALVKYGFFADDRRADAQLRRATDGFTLVLVSTEPHPGAELIRSFQTVSQELADLLAPMHVELALSDDSFEVKTEVHRLPREKIGAVSVFLLDGATAADAHRYVDTIVQGQLIKLDEPHRYELRRAADGFIISVTLQDGAWDKPEVIATWTKIAAALGKDLGKRVRYRLCDTDFALKRTVP